MSTEDVDKMMKDYRKKVLASRTRYQRFVDIFSLVPITVYFFFDGYSRDFNRSWTYRPRTSTEASIMVRQSHPLTRFSTEHSDTSVVRKSNTNLVESVAMECSSHQRVNWLGTVYGVFHLETHCLQGNLLP
ncbi:MAG: hypothetical protein ACUVXA_11490 [Candidatus Jordarchaeum sp.]|uniref:hypothetical protein n=1 Tax=Candidatus Jordarchaeum sp. TaxID=2823881 RepID=UPI00404B6882